MITNTAIHPEVNQLTLQLAMNMIDEEIEKLHALAIVLTNRLEPEDQKNPTNDLISWRVAEVLQERLGEVEFFESIRELLHVSKADLIA
jgi:hypothetical protein